MELSHWELHDPARAITEIAQRVSLTVGSAYAALVADPSTTQTIVRVDRLRTPAEILDARAARDEITDVVRSWDVIEEGPRRHVRLGVIVRPGLCVFGPNEGVWLAAETYADQWPLFSGHTILVTEHGWVDFMTNRAGATPALQPAG